MTGYVFAGFVFWLFCFFMSRYSQMIERRLATGHERGPRRGGLARQRDRRERAPGAIVGLRAPR